MRFYDLTAHFSELNFSCSSQNPFSIAWDLKQSPKRTCSSNLVNQLWELLVRALLRWMAKPSQCDCRHLGTSKYDSRLHLMLYFWQSQARGRFSQHRHHSRSDQHSFFVLEFGQMPWSRSCFLASIVKGFLPSQNLAYHISVCCLISRCCMNRSSKSGDLNGLHE